MEFIGAEYAFGFLGFIMVIGCLWNFQIEGALIVIVLTLLGVCFYRKKHAKGKKKWLKHRDPGKYKSKQKGLKGVKSRVSKGGGGGNDGDDGRGEGLLGGVGMGGSATQMGGMAMAKGMGAVAKFGAD